MRLWEPASLREPIDQGPEPLDRIEVIKDPRRIRGRIHELSGSARHSIYALQPSTGAHFDRTASRARSHAVSTRLVVEKGPAGEYGDALVRCSAYPLPCRMVIIDEAVAVTAGPGSASRGGAMVIEQPVLVQGLLCLFETVWATCMRATPDSPTPVERNLLERMATGSTDEAIARRLGISDRQVRRQIARLLQRLGVSVDLLPERKRSGAAGCDSWSSMSGRQNRGIAEQRLHTMCASPPSQRCGRSDSIDDDVAAANSTRGLVPLASFAKPRRPSQGVMGRWVC